MLKNPFKAKGLTTTITNTVVGGAASVAIDYAVEQLDFLKGTDPMYLNIGKIVGGALLGSMSKNKYVHAATDGIATVGAANLVSSLMATTSAEAPAGLPRGTVGRVRQGDPYFKRAAKGGRKGFTISGAFVGK